MLNRLNSFKVATANLLLEPYDHDSWLWRGKVEDDMSLAVRSIDAWGS